jgi:hypothetical protein
MAISSGCGNSRASKGDKSMQLSILIATNRKGLLACSRIAQACSWATPDIEVIIRDNSGDPQKRKILAQFRGDHRNIILADPCDALTNLTEILRLAKGEFIFLLADDDFCFDHAVAALPALIKQFGKNPSIAGVTGAYIVEGSRGSEVISYKDAESDDVVARVAGYLSYGGANILHYAPVRRDIVQRVFAFMNSLPFYFSFHDQIVCLLYLLNGKFFRLKRFLYLYDLGPWETGDTAQMRDADYYRAAGLDLSINALHWFMCGFEGAVMIRTADVFPDYPITQRQLIADRWFSSMFVRFKEQTRLTFGSKFAAEAKNVSSKLLTSSGALSFQDLLAQISGLMALFSKDKAQRYYDFWDAAISQPKPAAHVLEASADERAVKRAP